MGLLDSLKRKKVITPEERRQGLLAHGRITDGVILDTQINDNGDEVAMYLYTLNGVDFESADILTEAQRADQARYAPGAKVAIRYDPKNQGNSIIE